VSEGQCQQQRKAERYCTTVDLIKQKQAEARHCVSCIDLRAWKPNDCEYIDGRNGYRWSTSWKI